MTATLSGMLHAVRAPWDRRRRGSSPPPEGDAGAQRVVRSLRASESGLTATLDNIRDAVITLDTCGRVARMNDAAERITGWTMDDALLRPLAAVVVLYDQPSDTLWPELGAETLTRGLSVDATDQVCLERRDGRRIPLAMTCTPTGAGAVLVLRDATDERRHAARLDVTERLAALSSLAEGMAHEINNPLASVDANAAYLTRGLTALQVRYPDAPVDDLLAAAADIRTGAARVAKAVATLEALQRSRAAEQVPVHVPTLLDAALDVAGNSLRHRAHVFRDYAAGLPPVMAVPHVLEQAFLNVLLNAAEAIPSGTSTRHEVHVSCHTGPAGHVCVEVRDSGAGIEPSVQPRVFDAFFTTRPGAASGLGLALVQGTVRALGGHVDFRSAPGQGTTFRIALPRAQSVAPARMVASVAPRSAAGAHRILVVDDERPVLRSLTRLLRDGRQVHALTCAQEALERLLDREGEPYDLVLCDLMMPDMTGMDLHAEVARLAPDYLDRLVFMTGGAFTPRARDFLEQVDNVCIRKPFDLDELRVVVG